MREMQSAEFFTAASLGNRLKETVFFLKPGFAPGSCGKQGVLLLLLFVEA